MSTNAVRCHTKIPDIHIESVLITTGDNNELQDDKSEDANNVFEARICFLLHYTSVISVLNVIS